MTLEGYRAVSVENALIELPSQQPVVVMHEITGDRVFPLWIGSAEFAVISNLLDGSPAKRPLTHDLLLDIVDALDANILRVRIVDVDDMTFHARIDLDNGRDVDSRASDAVILGLQLDVPILITSELLDHVGVVRPVDEDPGATEAQVEEFKEFLEGLDPSDFKD